MDDDDGSMILMVYPSAVLELSLNVTMLDFVPYAAGGDIDTWEISPALPLGLNFDGVSPARSTTHTGVISGTPTELMDPTLVHGLGQQFRKQCSLYHHGVSTD